MDMSTDTNADARGPGCLRDERPVRRCTAAASSALGRGLEATVRHVAFWIALDVPSGVNATTGETPAVAVDPDVMATLALPKTGLATVDGDVRLIDLSIPAIVYERLGIEYAHPFGSEFVVPLERSDDER